MKDLYQSRYGKLPDKIAIQLISQKGEELLRTVAVYPKSFTPQMDEVIHQYMKKLKRAEEQQIKNEWLLPEGESKG